MAGGKQLYSRAVNTKMQTPVIVANGFAGNEASGDIGPTTYALGVAVTNYRGHKLVIHGGGIDGFLSQMSWLPNERIGAIVLTNSTAANIANIITYKIYDTFLGLEPVDWIGRQKTQMARGECRADSVRRRAWPSGSRGPAEPRRWRTTPAPMSTQGTDRWSSPATAAGSSSSSTATRPRSTTSITMSSRSRTRRPSCRSRAGSRS